MSDDKQYQRLESLSRRIERVTPDSIQPAAPPEVEMSQARVADQEAMTAEVHYQVESVTHAPLPLAAAASTASRWGRLSGPWGVVGLFSIAYALIYIAWTQFHWGGEENASFIADLANIPIAFLATVTALRVALGRQHDLKLRRAWFALGLGLGASALGEVLWFYINSVLGMDAFPSIADLFYLAFYPLVLLGLVILPNAPLSREARAKFWFDIVIVSTVAGMYIWSFILAPTLANTENDLLSQFLAGVYPVADLMVITGMMALIFRRVDAATRRTLLIFSLGLVAFASADLFFGYTSLFAEFTPGTLGDAGYVVSYVLFGLAGLRQAYAGGGVDFRRGRWLDYLATTLPFAAILLGYGLALFIFLASPELNNQLRGVFAGAILLSLLIAARQLVALRENEMLNGRLRTAAGELRTLSKDLEQRVASRTRDLALAAEIGHSISQVRDLDSLLSEAVELIRSRFDLYYAQVYLTDPTGRTLVLQAGTGSTGTELLRRSHRLPIGPGSLNGRAAAEKQAVIVSDTATNVSFRPNPLLPLTRSEMVMPLVMEDRVVGVLDLQHSQPGAFTAEALPAFEAVAGQLAVAIRNAALFTQAEQARLEVEAQAHRLAQAGWADFLNGVERSERIGYTFDANGLAPVETAATPAPDQPTLAAPILVSGEPVGLIQLEGNVDRGWTNDEAQVVNAVARQVAQQVENLRLLAQAEQARAEVEAQARRLTREGWQDFLQRDAAPDQGYVYDLNQVAPLAAATNGDGASALTWPLTVQGETIGELAVDEFPERLSDEAAGLAAAVSEHLSAHIENLRLTDQTRTVLTQVEQQATELRALFAAMPDVVLVYDEHGRYLKIAPTNPSLLYKPPADMLGKTVAEVLPAPQAEAILGHIRRALQTREALDIEYPLSIGGQEIWFSATVSSLTASTVFWIARDITARKQAEEELARRTRELEEATVFLDSVIENLPIMLFVKGAEELRFVRWNKAGEELIGFKREDLLGKNDYDFFPKEEADFFTNKDREVLAGGTLVDIAEEPIQTAQQGTRLLHTRKIPIYSMDGQPKYLLGISEDITERKRAENALAKHAVELETVARVSTAASSVLQVEALLQEVVDLTRSSFNLYHAHVYLLNEPGDMLVLSAGAGNVGKKMVEIGRRIPLNHDHSLVARAARTRRGVVANDVTREPDFLPNPLLPQTRSEMAVPMVVGDKLLGVFDVQSDVANRFTDDDLRIQMTLAGQVAVALQNARLYAEQTETVARLRELDQLKSSFLANMSHELRTPLNSILGFAEVMLEGIDGDLTDRMDNDLQVIYKNGQHLLTLINDILDMAKIEAGKMSLTIERFNLQEVLEEVAALTMPLAQNKSLELRLETGITDYLEVEADRTRLRQVMTNLINNAIKFTESGWVSINARLTGAHMLISIHDTGVGVPPGQLETIFQEFHQVDSSTTRKAGGTGLGLPISRHLIELHNGRLWAESSGASGPEGGTTFFVELPAQSSYDPNAER